MSSQIRNVKTSFKKVFRGNPEHFANISRLIKNMNRLVIHATHFSKYYILNCPQNLQLQLGKDEFKIILILLNSSQRNTTVKPSREKDLANHFLPYILSYKEIVIFDVEKTAYITQALTNHATLLATNFIVNIQEHFIMKLRKFITTIFVKRRPSFHTLQQSQRISRLIVKALLQDETSELNDLHLEYVNVLRNHLSFPARKDASKSYAYDVKVQPLKYLHPYLRLHELYEEYHLPSFNVVPLSSSAIPRHVVIDTTNLAFLVLKHKKQPVNLTDDVVKYELWNQVFKLENKAFKPKNQKGTKFTGCIKTDGISVSIEIGPQTCKGPSRKRKKSAEDSISKEKYFQDVDPATFKGKSVFIDPNKRDLLYCLGSNDEKLRYTQSQREHETKSKKYRNIRQTLTNEHGMQGKPYDTIVPKTVLNPDGFNIYLRNYFATLPEKELLYHLEIFRKLKLNTYINTQKSEDKFVKKFKKKFGNEDETTVFIGDWDSGNYTLPGQITTKGVGFRKMFRNHHFQVHLVNEFRTSKTCPCCSGDLETFRVRKSPKPWKRDTKIIVHGLLRCQSEICQLPNNKHRLWNRDDVATLNIRSIVVETLQNGSRPLRFRRRLD